MSEETYSEIEVTSNTKGKEFVKAFWELAKAIKYDIPFIGNGYRDFLLTEFNIWAINTQKSLFDFFGLTEEQAFEIIRNEKAERRLHTLSTMPYKDYLQTPEWKERRQHILERDGYRCQVCNSSNHLNVHHRDYTRRGHENDVDLTTLCQECHQIFHENRKLVKS